MKAFSIKGIWHLLKDSFNGFIEDKVPKLSGSLAYFTIFSLGPMLLVVIFLAGLVLGKQAVEGSLYVQIQQVVGQDAALQLQQLIVSASASKSGVVAVIVGFVTLLIGATSVFAEVQDSINSIWQLKINAKRGWLVTLMSRLISFGIIAAIGFLFLVSLAASAILEALGDRLGNIMPGISRPIFLLAGYVLTLLFATILFSFIFKTLPAAHVRWKDVWPGALVTAFLFIIGRFGISFYISQNDFGSTYGAAGSLVVIIVWIYYSSLIFYFGAEFTKAYTNRFGAGIRPKSFAVSTAANKNDPVYTQ